MSLLPVSCKFLSLKAVNTCKVAIFNEPTLVTSSSVQTYLDMTNQHVGHIIKLRLSETYIDFSKDLLSSCSIQPDLVRYL